MKERWQLFRKRSDQTAHPAPTVPLPRQWLARYGLGRWLFALILAVGLALVGPYGTYLVMSLPMRLGYWIIIITFSFALWWLIEIAVARLFGQRGLLFEQLTVIVPFAALNSAFLAGLHTALNAVAGLQIATAWSFYFWGHLVLSSFVIAPLILLTHELMTQVQSQASSDTIQFLTRALPPAFRGQTPYALAAEGHYVRVHTALGDTLVTMRFEDAVRALSGVEGIQTHRSWWVTLDQIVEVKPVGSAYEAVLRSGMTIPISRRRKAAVSKGLDAAAMVPA